MFPKFLGACVGTKVVLLAAMFDNISGACRINSHSADWVCRLPGWALRSQIRAADYYQLGIVHPFLPPKNRL